MSLHQGLEQRCGRQFRPSDQEAQGLADARCLRMCDAVQGYARSP